MATSSGCFVNSVRLKISEDFKISPTIREDIYYAFSALPVDDARSLADSIQAIAPIGCNRVWQVKFDHKVDAASFYGKSIKLGGEEVKLGNFHGDP